MCLICNSLWHELHGSQGLNPPRLEKDVVRHECLHFSCFRDFLCGFRKRKLERKKKAQEDIERLLKDERKRIKQEVRYFDLSKQEIVF